MIDLVKIKTELVSRMWGYALLSKNPNMPELYVITDKRWFYVSIDNNSILHSSIDGNDSYLVNLDPNSLVDKVVELINSYGPPVVGISEDRYREICGEFGWDYDQSIYDKRLSGLPAGVSELKFKLVAALGLTDKAITSRISGDGFSIGICGPWYLPVLSGKTAVGSDKYETEFDTNDPELINKILCAVKGISGCRRGVV